MSDGYGNDSNRWPPPQQGQQPPSPPDPTAPWPQPDRSQPPSGSPADPTAPWPQAPLPAYGGPGLGPDGATRRGSVRRGVPLGRLALLASIVVVAAAGGFALWRALSNPGGAETPQEAAAQFFDAAESEDLLGIVEVILPSEREAVVEPMTAIAVELIRLDQLADSAVQDGDLANISGVTVDVPDDGQPGALVYEVEPLWGSEKVHWVTVTDGTLTMTFDPEVAKGGLGGRLQEWIDAETSPGDLRITTETVDLGDEYANGEPLEFAVVEEDGSWYVSLWYTVAGHATGGEAPDPLSAPTPAGAASAEEAATQFIRDLIEFDMEGAMTRLDPDEFRALYDYWGYFGPELAREADTAVAEAAAEGVRWSVQSIETSSQERNGRTVATIDRLAVEFVADVDGIEAEVLVALGDQALSVDGTIGTEAFTVRIDEERASGHGSIEGETFEFDIDLVTYEGFAHAFGQSFEMVRDGDCLLVTTQDGTERVCDEDFGMGGSSAALDLQQDWAAISDRVGTPGLTVVERDGGWYVSGFPSWAYLVVDLLAVIEPDEVDGLIDSYGELFESFQPTQF